MCAKVQTVGPQVYIRTWPCSSDSNGSFTPVSVLWRRSGTRVVLRTCSSPFMGRWRRSRRRGHASSRLTTDQLELQFSRLAAEFDQGDYWDQEGSNSPIDWIRFNCHITSNAAGARIAVGENLARMAESAQAMRSGEIGFTHLTSMARTANAVGKAFDEKKLLELAREGSPGKFHYRCLHYRHTVQPKVVAAEQAELAETNFLHLNTQDDGFLFFTGCLDPVGGAVGRNARQPFAPKSGADDYRDAPKR